MKFRKLLVLHIIILLSAVVMGCSDGKQDTEIAANSSSIATVPTKPLPESGAEVYFFKPKLPGYISVSGLSIVESWGRWSDGDKVILKFGSNLPAKFSLTIAAMAYGPNAGEPVIVRAGNQTKEYTFGADAAKNQSVQFSPSVPVDTIEILIPKPTSPSSNDTRRLGLGFRGLALRAIP